MNTTIFDAMSHAEFLRLTLEAFARQGFAVEQSATADADAVLRGKTGARIAVLCKKYRGAFIGRPVLQQFYGAMAQLRCPEGYLISTTDCSRDAADFAAGKSIVLYNRSRTIELLRAAYGDEFIRTGRMPDLGRTTGSAPAVRRTVSVPVYEKAASPEPAKEAGQGRSAGPERRPMRKPEPAEEPETIHTPEPARPPEPAAVSAQTAAAARPESPGPERAPAQETGPQTGTAQEPRQEQPAAADDVPAEEVHDVQSIESPGEAETVLPERSTIIVCLECNNQLRVPIDQGMITVTCPECGMRRIYQPDLDERGELRTTTVITCMNCSQKLNVPTNRGQLKVRCPQCRAAWLFNP